MRISANANDWQTRIRLFAAIIMAMFAVTYFIYYILGLISIEAMETYQDFLAALTPVFFFLPLAILTHVSLGLWKLYKRTTLKMPLWEISQIFLGLCIPVFFIPYLARSYGMAVFFGAPQTYIDQLRYTYPLFAWQFAAFTLAVWLHAQFGAHVVLRLRPWYPKLRWVIVAVFSLIPVLALAGYFKGEIELAGNFQNKEWLADEKPVLHPASPGEEAVLNGVTAGAYAFFPALYAFVFAARGLRLREKNKHKNVKVKYADGRSVAVFPGTTILEASRIGNIPHASICGGRGRCTTCRVKVEEGAENLSPLGEREARALHRIGAEKTVRLACQSQCRENSIGVTLLLPPETKSRRARGETRETVGTEKNLAVMFIDLRGFTRLAEGKFPYDVVFILNRYFAQMGELIEKHGGTIDKFLGDGILAFFGADCGPAEACRQAFAAAEEMAAKLKEINEELRHTLTEPLGLGIGLHYGEVIFGELGYKDKVSLTIIGDTVNIASRLEALNKKVGTQLIFSESAAEYGPVDFSKLRRVDAVIRGRKEPMEIYLVKDIIADLGEPNANRHGEPVEP